MNSKKHPMQDERRIRLYRWLVWGILVAIYLIVFFQRLSVGVIAEDLNKSFGIGATQIANLGATEIDLSTENAIQFRETKKLLDAAIEKLPPQQKLVYNLCNIEGLKQKDVANQLNISPSTVKTHLRDAVKAIKNYLSTHDEVIAAPLLLFFLK